MIKSKKQRPPNGTGANGLRGGTNLYSTKTTIHRWLDDVGGPMEYKRGFTTINFETEAQHQQLGVTLKRDPYYGAPLPLPEPLKQSTSSHWESTTRTMQKLGIAKVRHRIIIRFESIILIQLLIVSQF